MVDRPSYCSFSPPMSYYISHYDAGSDGEQPHNFILENGRRLRYHYEMKYSDRRNISNLYQWLNWTEYANNDQIYNDIFDVITYTTLQVRLRRDFKLILNF